MRLAIVAKALKRRPTKMKNIKKLGFRLYEETYHVIAGNMQHRFGAPYYVHKFISQSVIRAIGFEHLKLCSRNQLHLMDKVLDEKSLPYLYPLAVDIAV